MRERTWLPAKPKAPSKRKVADDVREAVDALAAPLVAKSKKRYCKKPNKSQFIWPDDLCTRWHRDALYFVVVMQTPHGRPPTLETHPARMEHAGDGKFNLANQMQRGWNTIKKDATAEECPNEISEYIYF